MLKNTTKRLSRAGVIAGLYVVLALITMPVASGAIQFRASEFLTLLPLFYIEAVPALFLGCMVSNFITGCILPDVLLGSLVTLTSALLTFIIGKIIKQRTVKIILGGMFPILLNAFLLPLIWLFYGAGQYLYILQVLFLFISQSVVIYLLGSPVCIVIERLRNRKIAFFE